MSLRELAVPNIVVPRHFARAAGHASCAWPAGSPHVAAGPARASSTMRSMPHKTRRVLVAKPRGYCAGVDRAVQTVEVALERFGPPVYVRKQIVHNKHVVAGLEKRGAVFVEDA